MNPLEAKKTKAISKITIVIFLAFASIAAAKNSPMSLQVAKQKRSMTLAFTANQGQWDSKVSFRANAGGATMWFAPDGAYYQFSRTIESNPISIVDKRYDIPDEIQDRKPKTFESMMIKANFVGANANPIMTGVNMLEYKCNYFIGNNKSKWRTDVPNYTAIMYKEIYDGIDLQYYGNGKQLEYDFIVSPGADYSQIEIQYEGTESLAINNKGELVVTTSWGEVIEQPPVIYQLESDNSRVAITGKYKLNGADTFGFKLIGYNPELLLVIDPILSYSTYLGGNINEIGQGIAVDNSGAAYVIGITTSTDFPTFNPYQGTFQGSSDAFVTKLSSTGDSLIYSTYFGGSFFEDGYGIAVDASGAAYLTGETDSEDFPILNAYQGTFQGINDAYVVKLSSSGGLVYSTYLGGDNYDYASGIDIDASGAAYVTGNTSSLDFPMLNPQQGSFLGGSFDVFVTKLSSSGSSLVYSTYLGGSKNDFSHGIAIDASGAAYVTGQTYSTDFQTFNAFQAVFQGGSRDAFVTKLNISGSSLDYSTYLGGSDIDLAHGITVNALGEAYITGRTASVDFPILNAYQETFQGGLNDVFVTKLNSAGNALVYSTFLGGSVWDEGYGIEVDASGAAYVTGQTSSADYPMFNPYQGTNQGFSDLFVTKLNSSGNGLVFSTYLGGVGIDYCYGIAIDSSGAAYVTGQTSSTDFPTFNPYQDTYNGGTSDAFVVRFTTQSSTCCDKPGDVNHSGGGVPVDVLDILALVSYLFQGGEAPICLDETDATGGCEGPGPDVVDLLAIVGYLFQGAGDLPSCHECGW